MLAPERTFDGLYGLEVLSEDVAGEGVVRGRLEVRPEILDRHGAVHGGVYAAAAESLASSGTAVAVLAQGNAAMGLSNDTTVLERVGGGTLELEARAVSRGAGAWLWTVDARDGEGRAAAHCRVIVAVRPLQGR